MKTLEGSKGVGVLFIESERQIESLIQLLYSQNENVDLLILSYNNLLEDNIHNLNTINI
mgnify:CR=1 FL=1